MVPSQIWARNMEILKIKTDLRKQMKLRLKAMTREEKQALDEKICERVLGIPEIAEAKKIYGYMSLSWETGTEELLKKFWDRGVLVALPKVLGSKMKFFEVKSLDDLEEGAFHILEPGASCKQVLWPDAVMLVPGLAFSKDGRRLGKGGGYYDKFLMKEPEHKTIALAYEFQITDEIPVQEHDRLVDMVLTESGMY